jgi:diacylglycerol O-acyltransferase
VPGALRLLRDALADHLRQLARLPGLVVRTARSLHRLRARRRAAGVGPPALFEAPDTPWNHALSPRRSFATTALPLDDCKRLKDAFGATLGDVVHALAAGAARRYLAARDRLPDLPLSASVPVSASHAPRASGNRTSYFQTRLRTDLVAPWERLLATREVTLAAKEQLALLGPETVVDWMDYLPPLPYTWLRRLQGRWHLADHLPSPSNLVVSNVPGPRESLFWSGSRLLDLYSVGPLSEGMGLNLTVWSYGERLYFGILACRRAVPDASDLADGLHAELAALLAVAEQRA